MSGQGGGFSKRGRGNSGRFSGRSNSNNNKNNRSGRGPGKNNSQAEMKFTPYYTGKQQGATFDTVKYYLLLQMQKTFRDGLHIVQALRDDTDDFGVAEPTRDVSIKTDPDEFKLEQDGFDIDYKEERKNYIAEKKIV